MKGVVAAFTIVALNAALALGQGLFPFLWCTSTTTLSLTGAYTVTATSTVGSATRTVTVTALPTVSIQTITTTSYIPTSLSCLSSATTLPPRRAGIIPLQERQVLPTGDCEEATIIPPTVSREPCTKLAGSFEIVTDITTVTTSGVATTTVIPSRVINVTETWIQPTPTAYDGVNYYQYINDYYYPDGTGGCANCGYGGGGYDTADWNGNTSYHTSGLTRDISFQSQNYLDWSTIYCQLPGQASATWCAQWTVVFQGFLHARTSGTYTVVPDLRTDNAIFFWGGEKAYVDYENGNVDGGVSYTQPQGLPHSYDYELVAGEFYPVTFIFANGFGPLLNRVDISGPNGTSFPGGVELFVPPCPDSPFVP
ncbi:hypothetical protein BJY00DRAFT_315713 [Aspergillus carlsbadensis]|nr:hypothetical protein BJY00DRAFT_315713 [Aspergillus carlsbadensis]